MSERERVAARETKHLASAHACAACHPTLVSGSTRPSVVQSGPPAGRRPQPRYPRGQDGGRSMSHMLRRPVCPWCCSPCSSPRPCPAAAGRRPSPVRPVPKPRPQQELDRREALRLYALPLHERQNLLVEAAAHLRAGGRSSTPSAPPSSRRSFRSTWPSTASRTPVRRASKALEAGPGRLRDVATAMRASCASTARRRPRSA